MYLALTVHCILSRVEGMGIDHQRKRQSGRFVEDALVVKKTLVDV